MREAALGIIKGNYHQQVDFVMASNFDGNPQDCMTNFSLDILSEQKLVDTHHELQLPSSHTDLC